MPKKITDNDEKKLSSSGEAGWQPYDDEESFVDDEEIDIDGVLSDEEIVETYELIEEPKIVKPENLGRDEDQPDEEPQVHEKGQPIDRLKLMEDPEPVEENLTPEEKLERKRSKINQNLQERKLNLRDFKDYLALKAEVEHPDDTQRGKSEKINATVWTRLNVIIKEHPGVTLTVETVEKANKFLTGVMKDWNTIVQGEGKKTIDAADRLRKKLGKISEKELNKFMASDTSHNSTLKIDQFVQGKFLQELTNKFPEIDREAAGRKISKDNNFGRQLYETAKRANGTFHDSDAWKKFRHSLNITTSLAAAAKSVVKKLEKENINPEQLDSRLDTASVPFNLLNKSAQKYIRNYCREHQMNVQKDLISYTTLCKILGSSREETARYAGEYEKYKLADHLLPGEEKTKRKTKELNSDDLEKLRIVEQYMKKEDRQLEKAEADREADREADIESELDSERDSELGSEIDSKLGTGPHPLMPGW